MPEIHLSGAQYVQLRDFFSREFGLYFEPDKVTFLENRIIPLIRDMKLLDLNGFLMAVSNDQAVRDEVLNALTTNETWFFRHPRHFDILREDVLPNLVRERLSSRRREITIWSAGCSIGAEAFSIAITLHEVLRDCTDWKVRIIGSDISHQALDRARQGIYTSSEVRLLSSLLLTRYFIPTDVGMYAVKPELKELVQFEFRNLLDDQWPDREFDVIFCRNTMIYFKEETKAKLTERFYKALRTGGIFVPGATESLHWKGDEEFRQEFLRGEYIYHKQPGRHEYLMLRFATSSELLRALNLLVKGHYEYQLKPVPQISPIAPKKALVVPERLAERVEKIFSDSDIKPLSRETFQD